MFKQTEPLLSEELGSGTGYGEPSPMKDLEKENLRLRRAISDLTLDKLILQEAARGNF